MVFTRSSRLELRESPIVESINSFTPGKCRILRNQSNMEINELSWNDDNSSSDVDNMIDLLNRMRKPSLRISSMILMRENFKRKGFNFFEIRANGLISRICDFLCEEYPKFNKEERIESIVIMNLMALDMTNIEYMPPISISRAIQTIPLSEEDSISLFKSLRPLHSKIQSLEIPEPEYIISAVHDEDVITQLIAIQRSLIKFVPFSQIASISNNSPSILIDATCISSPASKDKNIRSKVIEVLEKGEIGIGSAALCNILHHDAEFKNFIKQSFIIKKRLREASHSTYGTMPTIALSFLECNDEVISQLQHWLMLETNHETRKILRSRLDELS